MAAPAIPKTNAMRALDQRNIPYQAHLYSPEIKSAEGVAAVLGVPATQVYKTLVMVRDGNPRPLLVMAPGGRDVDIRALAKHVGCKSIHMAPKSQAERVTGLQTGGIGALALLNRPFDIYIDRDALTEDVIFVNGGRRGLNLQLKSRDLIDVTGARPVQTGAE